MVGRESHKPLVVTSNAEPAAAPMLRELGYSEVSACRPEDAVARAAAAASRLVILDLGDDGLERSLEIAQQLRARATEYVYVICVVPTTADEAAVHRAFQCGVDDVLGNPLVRARLASRLHVADRVLELELKLRSRVKELETALRRLEVSAAKHAPKNDAKRTVFLPSVGTSPSETFATMSGYRNVVKLLSESIGSFLGHPFLQSDSRALISDPRSVRIALTEPTRNIEFNVGLVASDGALAVLSEEILGDGTDPENREALLLETANIVMGSIKAAFLSHELTFTGGLPLKTTAEELKMGLVEHAVHFRQRVAYESVEIEVFGFVLDTENRRVQAASAREGMVVTDDVRGEDAQLIVAAGTRLTASLAEKLTRLVPFEILSVTVPAFT